MNSTELNSTRCAYSIAETETGDGIVRPPTSLSVPVADVLPTPSLTRHRFIHDVCSCTLIGDMIVKFAFPGLGVDCFIASPFIAPYPR
jgi:hypothetical protein